MQKKIFIKSQLFVALVMLLLPTTSTATVIKGVVRDSVTSEPLPYVSVTESVTGLKTLSDGRGIFEFNLPEEVSTLNATAMGYNPGSVNLQKNGINLYVIYLTPSVTELKEITIKKKKYTKKNNPAVDFVTSIRKKSHLTDPRNNPYYSYRSYEKISLALNDFDTTSANGLIRRIPELKEHISTGYFSDVPVLNVALREKVSEHYYRKTPRNEKTIVRGIKADGIDEIADVASMQTFYEDVLRGINLYDRDITILQNKFVSPLSPIGPDFYEYYLVDTAVVRADTCLTLAFYPRNRADFGFTGHIYVPVNDSTMFIKKVELSVPKDINLNFITALNIEQEYAKASDGSRILSYETFGFLARPVPGTPELQVSKEAYYDRHSFEAPDAEVFLSLGSETKVADSNRETDTFWEQNRLVPLSHGEENADKFMTHLRQAPAFYWGEKILKLIFTGYVPIGKPDYFLFGPLNSTITWNTAEGLRLQAGGITTARLSKRIFFRGNVAYGFRDHRWKYTAEAEYSFIDKENHSREFPVNALRIGHSYNLYRLGQNYLFTSPDNFVLAWKRCPDTRVVYRRHTSFQYILELENNFSVQAEAFNTRFTPSMWMNFDLSDGTSLSNLSNSGFRLKLRYAPGEKFYQTRTHRIPINLDAPVIELEHTYAPAGWLGAKYTLNFTTLKAAKRFWLSAFGYLDTFISAGHIFSAVPYPWLLTPNVNLSYTIQPEAMQLMNPMEWAFDSMGSWDITYWLNGVLFNRIPLLKKLKLREVIAFRGAYGYLSDKNNPSKNHHLPVFPGELPVNTMNHGPYMEISAGIDNILKCLRVDFVRRLTYLDPGYSISKNGVRVALHITF
ncbi:MAG: DUF5686 and carboxypeptidase regulatory-like domain-containing protein [Muribaculaceae bacterium]|nr:DUF5686 and carboxypeptidase regulatory-like domain-containing protein [Muribaculaceae bacterium]